MRVMSLWGMGVCLTLVVMMMMTGVIRTVEGIRSMVMRPQARDLSLGSNDLQGLQSMWAKESQEDEYISNLAEAGQRDFPLILSAAHWDGWEVRSGLLQGELVRVNQLQPLDLKAE
ncbi:hypothetical protein SK128_014625 [Halocaridina rubra]|uniref:Uncharacterized protein n=1 Tax=Halocaridina rubra TaxID=373956 RepID=A0AAN8X6T2_HALRR